MDGFRASSGALLARLLRQPRHLRGADFEVRVSHFADWHPENPGRRSCPWSPALFWVDTLSVTGGHWSYTRRHSAGQVGDVRTSGVGPWWELRYPNLIEHLDPPLVLSSLWDFTATSDAHGPVLRAKPRRQGDVDAGAGLVNCDADVWIGSVDPAWGVLREVESRSDWAGGFRSVLEWEKEPCHQEAEPEGNPSSHDGDPDLWPEVLDAMLGAARNWEARSFRARLQVRYEGLGVAAMAVEPSPTSSQMLGLGQGWAARTQCRLFADTGSGPAQTLDDWIIGPTLEQGTGLICTEELSVEEAAWKSRRFRTLGGKEEDPYRVPPVDLSPRWLMARESGAIPHFREMLDPTLVLSSVEFDSMTEEEHGWLLRGRPRREDLSHGYYPAIVHPCGDLWAARLSKDWGSVSHCRTTLHGAGLASHDLTVEIRSPAPL